MQGKRTVDEYIIFLPKKVPQNRANTGGSVLNKHQFVSVNVQELGKLPSGLDEHRLVSNLVE